MKFAVIAALFCSVEAVQIHRKDYPDKPWDPTTLPDCPDGDRTIMDDGKTHVTKYPMVGSSCKLQTNELVQFAPPETNPWSDLEHCPDFDERYTLKDGTWHNAIPYPQPGYNCNPDWALAQNPPSDPNLEHCPDFDERMTLTDGKTTGIPYPNPGFNCNPEWSLSQRRHQGQLVQDEYHIRI